MGARFVPVLVPVGLAVALLALGHPTRAIPLLAIAAVVGVAIAAGIDVAGWVARLVARAGHALQAALGTVAFAVLIIPAWAWTRLRRRRPMGPARASGWHRVPAGDDRPRSLAERAPAGAVRPLWRSVVGALQVVLLVAAANYALGWGWDRITGRTGPSSIAESTGTAPRTRVADPRVDSPAMADAPWAERYFADLQATTVGYWPYTEYRPEPYRSPHLNLDGWTRRTYQTPGGAQGRPSVWMLGGSTTFGEGQRDEHTIASELVRLAEADGLPITMSNFGQRGWTHWQELILFEQRLELEPRPEVAVFYDGANEITSQALLNEAVPSNTQVLEFAERLAGTTVATRFVQGGASTQPPDDLWHAYSQHSLAHKLVYAFAPSAAGAAPAQDEPVNVDGATPATDGVGTDYALTPEDGTDAGRVYERGRRLTEQIARDADVVPLFLWQPVRSKLEPQARAVAELSDEVIDLTDALDGRDDVYIDGAHTNEEGARVVAQAVWVHLRPLVEAWYAEQP